MTKSFNYYLALLSLTIALFTGCQTEKTGYRANDDIDQKISTEITGLNKKLLRQLSENDIAGAKTVLSDSLLQIAGNGIDTVLMIIADRFKTQDFKVLDEYYVNTSEAKAVDTIRSNHDNDSDYLINYHAINNETYISLLTPAKADVKCMLFLTYGKYKDGWKINVLRVGEYSVLDKTAGYYYKKAVDQFADKHIIDAALSMVNASQMARPAGENFVYKTDKQMEALFQKAIQRANTDYQFPMLVKQVKTQPTIYFVNPQYLGEEGKKGIYPIVNYVSTIKLTDTVALKAENAELHKVIGQLFTGIDKNNSYITYSASNRIPDGKSLIDTYGFVQKVK